LLLADRHCAHELKELTLKYLGVVSNLNQVRKQSATAWHDLDKNLIDEILNSVASEASNTPDSACTNNSSPQLASKGMLVGPIVSAAAAAFAAFPQLHSQHHHHQQQHSQQQFVHFSQLFQPFVTSPAAFFL